MAPKKNFNVGKYFQLNYKTVQGKITLFLLTIVFLTALAFTISYQDVVKHDKRQAFMRKVLVPSISMVDHLHISLAEIKTFDKTDSVIQQLNVLANQWKGEKAVIFYSQFINELNQDVPDLELTDKTLLRTKEQLVKQLEESEQEAEAFKANFRLYLIGYFLFMVAFGFALATVVMKSLFGTIRKIKNRLNDISTGHLPDSIEVTNDEFRSIGRGMNTLVLNLNKLTQFAHQVGKGNFDNNIEAFDEDGVLGSSLAEMRDSLKKVSEEDKNRRWFNEGVAHFSEKLRTHNGNVAELCSLVMLDIAQYLKAMQGALYVAETEGSQKYLQMRACYAHDRQKFLDQKLPAENGLIGQVYLEQAPKVLTEIPANYQSIATGLGSGLPKCIIIVPMLHNDEVEGILELATLHQPAEHELEFINKLAELFGAAIAGVRISEETHKLLQESQMAAEQMRAQEEEMRQNAEELEATQEEIHRQIEESQRQQEVYLSLLNNVEGLVHRKALSDDLEIHFMNKQSTNFIGLNASEATHTKPSLLPYIHPEDRSSVLDQLKSQIAETGTYEVSYRLKRPNGQYVLVADKGSVAQDSANVLLLDGLIQVAKKTTA